MRTGFSLLELLLVLVLVGLLLAIGGPRVGSARDAARVREATARLMGAVEAARGAAVRLGQGVTLHLESARWEVRAIVGPDTTVAWGGDGHATLGVTLAGAGAPIGFGSAGLAVGVANRTFTLSRGPIVRTLVLSRLGRLR